MSFDISTHVVLVTGGGAGIGAGIVEECLRNGATVISTDISGASLAAEATRIDAIGLAGTLHTAVLDVTDNQAVIATINGVVSQHGRLDAVINSAGIFIDIDTAHIDHDAVRRVMEVNFFGTVNVSSAATSHLVASKGTIVNLATGGLDRPLPAQLAYLASKAAVVELTRTMALGLGPDGVRVNAVAPGYVDTAMLRRNHTLEDCTLSTEWEARLESYRDLSPLHLVGEASDVAGIIIYLLSPAARFVTGQTIRVNGGFAVPR